MQALVMWDFNIDPAISKVVTDEVMRGERVDAGTVHPNLDGSEPPWTFQQKGVHSRIDFCLLL